MVYNMCLTDQTIFHAGYSTSMGVLWPLVISGVVLLLFVIILSLIIIFKNCSCARQCVYEHFLKKNCHNIKGTPLNISILSLDELDVSNTSHRLLDKVFLDHESQATTSTAINSLLVDTSTVSVNFDLQETTTTTNSVPPQDSISTGSDSQQCNTSFIAWKFNSNEIEVHACTSNTSLSDTTSLSFDSNTNCSNFHPDTISTGSEPQQAITSSSTNSFTSIHQQDNSSGNYFISPLPRIRNEYTIMPDFCASR